MEPSRTGIVAPVRALITGIAGFAGHHLSAELVAAGYEVHGLDLRDDPPWPAGVTSVHAADITDRSTVATVVADIAPDVLFHLAGAASVGQSFGDPVGTWHVNLDGTLAVLEGLRVHTPSTRGVIVTSGDIYGLVPPDELPVGPATPMRPHSPYAASKAAADLAAGQYHDGYGLPVMRVRPFNHLGPGQDPRFVVPSVARQIAVGERDGRARIELHVGNIETRRDFSDVRDVVRAYRLIAERGDPSVPYLVCTGLSVSVRDLIEGLAHLSTADIAIASDMTLRREGEQPDLYGSPDRLRLDTGWTPEIPLGETLKDTLDWWRMRVAEEDSTV